MNEMTVRRGPLIDLRGSRRSSFVQRSFVLIGLIFLVSLGVSVAYRSITRRSIFGGPGTGQAAGTGTSSQLHLQDFSRVEVKDGRQIWQVKATDAKYYAQEDLTHVHNAKLTVYREKQPPVFIEARTAKLHLDGESLKRADLEGSISVSLRDGLKLVTEEASYDAGKGTVTSASRVDISGEGIRIVGIGMRLWVETEVFELLDEVDSQFEQGATVPRVGR
jgi:LPS export ABC transporter protein LptC